MPEIPPQSGADRFTATGTGREPLRLDAPVADMLNQYVRADRHDLLTATGPARTALIADAQEDYRRLNIIARRVQLVTALVRGQVDSAVIPPITEARAAARALLAELPLAPGSGGIDTTPRAAAAVEYAAIAAEASEETPAQRLAALEETGSIIARSFPARTKTLSEEEAAMARGLLHVARTRDAQAGRPLEMPEPGRSASVPPPLTGEQQGLIDEYRRLAVEEKLAIERGERIPNTDRPVTQALRAVLGELYPTRSVNTVTELLGLTEERHKVVTQFRKMRERGELRDTRRDVKGAEEENVAKRRGVVSRLHRLGVRPAAIAEVVGFDPKTVGSDIARTETESQLATGETVVNVPVSPDTIQDGDVVIGGPHENLEGEGATQQGVTFPSGPEIEVFSPGDVTTPKGPSHDDRQER